jgi:hypothetical protein
MAFLKDLEETAITLPLDVVLEVLRGTQGKLISPETLVLIRTEVSGVLHSIPGVEEEVICGVLREAFGDEKA